jgi:O-antigen/teichoic acid export membrane protein
MDPERRPSSFENVKQTIVTGGQDLIENVFLLGSYSILSVAFLVLFHLLMARYLGPQEYSVLGTFSSILLTVILMSSSIYLIITRFITYHHTRYQYEQINYLVRKSLKYFFASGLLLFLAIFIFAGPIASFFNIDHLGPVVMLGFAVWLQLLVPIYEGAFKGLDKLHILGRMRAVEAGSRWIIALILAYLLTAFDASAATKVTAMVFALGLGTFVALSYTYVHIRHLQRLESVEPNMQEIWDYAKPVVLITATMALLLNLDIILVKHFFPPEEAGVYAAASFLAKIPFMISWVFSSVIFPRVTKLHIDGRPSGHLLRFSLKWMSIIVIISTFISLFFAKTLLGGIFGPAYQIGNYLGLYAFSMGLLAIVNVLTIYQLALKKFTLSRILPWFFIAELCLLLLFHATLFQVVVITVFVTALLAATTLYVLRDELHLEYLFNE